LDLYQSQMEAAKWFLEFGKNEMDVIVGEQ
jgi:hypothetical protein